jgi:hypothetical protein
VEDRLILLAGFRRQVPEPTPGGLDRVRTAELSGALSLATDLGIGVPLEYGFHNTLVAMRLPGQLEVGWIHHRHALGLSLGWRQMRISERFDDMLWKRSRTR